MEYFTQDFRAALGGNGMIWKWVVHTGKRGVAIFLETVCVFSMGTGAWGHISSWLAKVPRGEIPGAGGLCVGHHHCISCSAFVRCLGNTSQRCKR